MIVSVPFDFAQGTRSEVEGAGKATSVAVPLQA
jgi:hypothetical protein